LRPLALSHFPRFAARLCARRIARPALRLLGDGSRSLVRIDFKDEPGDQKSEKPDEAA
jgi:hypothetical protein